MKELFKQWAKISRDFEEFDSRYSLWYLTTQEIDADNCISEEDLLSKYNEYKIKQ